MNEEDAEQVVEGEVEVLVGGEERGGLLVAGRHVKGGGMEEGGDDDREVVHVEEPRHLPV